MLLNGGALVAIPAAVALFGIDAKPLRMEIIETALWFLYGLGAAWVATALAYMTACMFWTVASLSRDIEAGFVAHRLQVSAVSADPIFEQMGIRRRREKAARALEVFAFLFSAVSIVMFAVGVRSGSGPIMHAPSLPPPPAASAPPTGSPPAAPSPEPAASTPSEPPEPATSPQTVPAATSPPLPATAAPSAP